MANGTQEKDLDRIVHVVANEIHLTSYILQILDAELHYGQIHDILQSFHQVDYIGQKRRTAEVTICIIL